MQKLITSRRLVLESLESINKLSADPSLTAKLRQVSELFDRLHYVTKFSYTLLRDQLNHVSAPHVCVHCVYTVIQKK